MEHCPADVAPRERRHIDEARVIFTVDLLHARRASRQARQSRHAIAEESVKLGASGKRRKVTHAGSAAVYLGQGRGAARQARQMRHVHAVERVEFG